MELQKMLVVDDDKSVQVLIRAGVSRAKNVQVKLANNGQEALEFLKTWTPELILMDVMMPVLGGLETLKIILQDQDLKRIPVVIMSATDDEDKIKSYIEQGAIGVIAKPFSPTEILNELNHLYLSTL